MVVLDYIADSRDSYEHIGSHIHGLEVEDNPVHKAVAAVEADMDLEAYSGPDVDPGTRSLQMVAVAGLDFAGSGVAEAL